LQLVAESFTSAIYWLFAWLLSPRFPSSRFPLHSKFVSRRNPSSTLFARRFSNVERMVLSETALA
jgi:hypothetical protein